MGNSKFSLNFGYMIFSKIEQLTPKQLLSMFPLDKTYNGEKWGCKDYFYSMDVIKKYGIDRRIENAPDFLWDYGNEDLREFLVNFTCLISRKYENITGRNMAQDGMEKVGIPYTALTHEGFYITSFDGSTRVEMPYLPAWMG